MVFELLFCCVTVQPKNIWYNYSRVYIYLMEPLAEKIVNRKKKQNKTTTTTTKQNNSKEMLHNGCFKKERIMSHA